MTVQGKRVCMGVLLTAALWPAAGWGQFGRSFDMAAMQGAQGHAISAMGTSTIQRSPTQLRLYLDLTAKGKNLKEALEKMKERQEAVTAQLETLKADKKSISFSTPSLSNAESARKKQLEMMVMAQMRSRGKKPAKGLQTPQTVTVTSTLTAQWPIAGHSPEKFLLAAQDIQDKVKAADLAGSKEAEKLTPEEEEFEEEAAQAANQSGNDEAQQSRQPQFLFVALLSKEDRQKGMTDAAAKAKEQAAELAKAAGVELGPLVGLSGGCVGQVNMGDENQYGGMYPGRRMFLQQAAEDVAGKPDESVGADPSALRFTCGVTALFQLGK